MPLQDIRFNPHFNTEGIRSFTSRITESEYLHALQIIKDYKNQINEDLNNLETVNHSNEKEIILIALRHNNNNRVKTAKHLNISNRTLYRKIKKYGLDPDTVYPDV